MSNQKRKKMPLFKLYLEYSFQKSTIIIMLLSFIIIGVALYFLVGDLDPILYLEGYEKLHNEYLEDAIIIVQILNSVIITALILILAHQSKDFDKLFITVFKRETIIIKKFLVVGIIILLSTIVEWLIIMTIAYFKFDRFYISYDRLIEIIYILLPALLDAAASFFVTLLAPVIFSPFLVLTASVILKFACFVSKNFNESVMYFLPALKVENGFITYNNYLYSLGIIIFLFLLSISIYSIRDIK